MKRLYSIILFASVIFAANADAQEWRRYGMNSGYSGLGNVFSDHEHSDWGINFGYVNKDWVTDFGNGDIYHENLWGEEDKKLHGIEFGVTYQPCTQLGLGFYTGLNMNLYFSFSDEVSRYSYNNDQFTEMGFYMPLHVMYRLPLGRTTSLSVHGGLGVDLAVVGEFSDFGDAIYDWVTDSYYNPPHDYLDYGRGEFPRHFNMSKEIAATLRMNHVQLTATFSRGFTNHAFYSKDHVRTNQNKFGLTLTIVE